MYIITGVFAFLFCLKLLAIGNAVRWMIKRGTEYRKSCEEQRPTTPDEFFAKFDQLDAKFLPFGFKDYRLRRAIGLQKAGLIKYLLRFFQNVLFRFNRLAAITFLYVIAALSFSSSDSYFAQPGWMLFGLILLVLLGNIALSIEAIISYTILGNYALLFHMLTPAETVWDAAELRFREIWVFVSKFLASIGSGAVAVFVTHVTFNGFSKLQPYDPESIVNWLELLFDSLYFTLATFLTVGYGDISPQNRFGQFVSILIMIQGVLLIVGVFASLQSSRFEKLSS